MNAKILVAEDEVGIRMALTILLEEEGYQVVTACDGNEALAVVRAKEFDLVISDIRMPGMSGLQFLEEVNKIPSAPEIILMTAFGSVETAIQAMKKGARDFLIKPFSNDLLKMTVKRVLERRELSEENHKLHELEKLKNEFIAMIAHELRTPLTAIKGYLSLVLTENAGPLHDLQKKYLRVVNQNSEKLQRIVEEVLDIAQMDKSEFHLHTMPSNLFSIIGKAVAVLQEAVEAKDIRLEVNFDAAAGPISVDRRRFKQVMVALVENAVAFSQAHRSVWISVKPWEGIDTLYQDDVPCSYVDFLSLDPGDYLEISVEDEGPGIPKDMLSEVFKKFYQVEELYVRQVGGMGLGLTLCKRLVETMGGRIWVKSQVGKGSKFAFILPWKKDLEEEKTFDPEEVSLADLPMTIVRRER
ncbi:MAG: response regulator [Candidatus Firestonebacteria bacterium]|nr:response regulator [Candidatus Firestonebacteria bacterium]